MARIRSIKPEFPQSESMGRISRDARLTFIQCWTLADDEGRLRGNSRMLASLLFPYDDDAPSLIDGWLGELERENCLIRYQVDGQSYMQVCNWLIHQKIDKPSKSKIPKFDESSRILANPREVSSEDQGRDQGSRRGVNPSPDKPARFDPVAMVLPECLKPESWAAWVSYRRKRKLTTAEPTMLKQLQFLTECHARGQPPDKIIDASITNGWHGLFELKGNGNGKNGSSRADRVSATIAELTGANRHPAPAIDGIAERVD